MASTTRCTSSLNRHAKPWELPMLQVAWITTRKALAKKETEETKNKIQTKFKDCVDLAAPCHKAKHTFSQPAFAQLHELQTLPVIRQHKRSLRNEGFFWSAKSQSQTNLKLLPQPAQHARFAHRPEYHRYCYTDIFYVSALCLPEMLTRVVRMQCALPRASTTGSCQDRCKEPRHEQPHQLVQAQNCCRGCVLGETQCIVKHCDGSHKLTHTTTDEKIQKRTPSLPSNATCDTKSRRNHLFFAIQSLCTDSLAYVQMLRTSVLVAHSTALQQINGKHNALHIKPKPLCQTMKIANSPNRLDTNSKRCHPLRELNAFSLCIPAERHLQRKKRRKQRTKFKQNSKIASILQLHATRQAYLLTARFRSTAWAANASRHPPAQAIAMKWEKLL